VASDNFDRKTSFNFDNSTRLPYRYAEALIFVILPYGAFHQINYVSALKFIAVAPQIFSSADIARSLQKFVSHERYSLERLLQASL